MRSTKNKKATYLPATGEEVEVDPHRGMSVDQKLKLAPEELVPQLSQYNTSAFRKREMKIMDKEAKREKSTFDANLFSEDMY